MSDNKLLGVTVLRQISSSYLRSDQNEKLWFTEESIDLFVWLSEGKEITKFQITYDKPNSEKSYTWSKGQQTTHMEVDEGSQPGKHPSSPILVNEIPCDEERLLNVVKQHKNALPTNIYKFIKEKITE